MSTFEVRLRKLDSIEPHPNADKLDLSIIGGYKSVIKKNEFVPGDVALYIPTDAIFTDLSIAEKLGVASYLIGKQKNRTKAIKLRGQLSEGFVVPVSKLYEAIGEQLEVPFEFNFSEKLKIEKYEEPIPITMQGKVRPWPSFLSKYDVENIRKPECMRAMINGEEIVATEKLHGTNMAIAIGPGLEDGEQVFVCSRNQAIKEDDGTNVYWRVAKKYNLIEKLQQYFATLRGIDAGIVSVSLHGEVVGVQDLKYGYVNGDVGFYAFDIKINDEFIDYDEFVGVCEKYDVPKVPLVFRGPYDYTTCDQFAQGKTTLGGVNLLEGVVVHPIVERRDYDIGRVQVKFISEEYLLRKEGTELH